MYTKYKKFFLALIAGLLVCSFIFTPVSQTFNIQKVEATVVVSDPYNFIPNWVSMLWNAASAASGAVMASGISSINMKEILDGIVWQLINLIIQSIIRSVTDWVRSGFNGSPAFVQDLGGFLMNIADQVAGDFIYGTELGGLLCSPFKLDLRLALDFQYRKTRGNTSSKCTLSGVIKNVQGFMDGNFLEGGWDGWYAVTMTPQNNPYGAMLEAQTALTLRISGAQKKEIKLLDFGKGLFSVKDPSCNKNAGPCKTVTPGTAVESMLNNTLDMDKRRLVVADEINELIGALLQQLTMQILGGVGGLLGLGATDSYGKSYFDRMAEEPQNVGGPSLTASSQIQTTIDTERKYFNLQTNAIALIQSVRTYKQDNYPDYDQDGDGIVDPNNCHSGTLTTSLSKQLQESQLNATSSRLTIDILDILQSDYTKIMSTSTPATTTQRILTKYDAKNTQEAQIKILDRYQAINSSSAVHSAYEIATLELDTIHNLKEEIKAFTDAIDSACQLNNNVAGG